MEIKTDFKEKAKPKVGSKDNMTYQPGELNENVQEEQRKLKKFEALLMTLKLLLLKMLFACSFRLKQIFFSLSQAAETSRYVKNFHSLREKLS